MTNRATVATLDEPDGIMAQLPIVLGDGWQILPIDLASLVVAIWGREFRTVEQVKCLAQ